MGAGPSGLSQEEFPEILVLFLLCSLHEITAGGAGGAGPSGLSQEEFPELPGMSKAAKKKARQQVGLVLFVCIQTISEEQDRCRCDLVQRAG